MTVDRTRRSGAALEKHYQFLLWLIPTLEKFPKTQKFLLGDRLQSLAGDVLERLIEATYAANLIPPLSACNLALEKMRYFVRLSHDLHHLDARRYEFAARAIDETGRLVGGWLKAQHAEKIR